MNVTGSDGASSRSRRRTIGEPLPPHPFYAICVDNGGGEYEIVLRLGKPYKVVKPWKNDPVYFFRVIDEEGEDYLYPRKWFVPIGLKPRQKRRLAAALAAAS